MCVELESRKMDRGKKKKKERKKKKGRKQNEKKRGKEAWKFRKDQNKAHKQNKTL